MKLNLQQIKDITLGAVNIYQEDGKVFLKRFTEEQEDLYQKTNRDFYTKSQSTAGIKFSFKTDSKNLFIKIKTSAGSSRKYFSLDVFEDGEPIGYIDNFSQNKLELDYTKQEFIFGDYSGNFELSGEGKVITVYFPWSAITLVEEISIDDNSYIEPVKPDKKILVFGDSITQGYDALRPSNRYASKISERLNAEEYNKGIGGERFFPELSYLKEPFMPDYIIVSYGSNDWFHSDAQTFVTKCTEFYRNLTDNYPGVKTFAISPIWREDCKDERPFGEFEKVDQYVSEITAEYDNVTVVRGLDFVPHDIKYYADLRLHPNDEGFRYYADNLYNSIEDKL